VMRFVKRWANMKEKKLANLKENQFKKRILSQQNEWYKGQENVY
jgi:hypothetical protein